MQPNSESKYQIVHIYTSDDDQAAEMSNVQNSFTMDVNKRDMFMTKINEE